MQQLATGLKPVMGQPAITRLEQMYVIAKLEQGQYVYYNQNTKKFSLKDNHASKWTSISAAREALHKLEEKQALKENLLNSLAIIAPLIPAEDNSIDLDKCDDALQNYLKVASARTYHFKDAQLKNNFKRYLEQSNGLRGQVDDLRDC